MKFEEIIRFAIQREQDAVDFYQELQAIARFQAQIEVLKEFEMMEHGHLRLLEGVLERKSMDKLSPKVPEDLKLSDYLVETPPTGEMSYQDILISAIKKEERSADLYHYLLQEAEDDQTKSIFQQLITEEQKHKHHFEVIYDRHIMTDN